ncbi:unnamed protein product [Mytilus coruscus]|uniref:HAT C-terminal dimerisation domain-containing protein n=1 Tax=Mytilus coruscus TaxID=42192 RepID=A0A6J8EZI6_MYTCO|nr:unnamed protein product [Mytilus coruscus]
MFYSIFGDVKQVRWLSSKERAIKTMLGNYEVVVAHLEHDFVAGSRTDHANRAKGYHTAITSIKFLKFLHFLMNYLPINKAWARSGTAMMELSHIEKLIDWMLTISPSTRTCKRGFSIMNTLKTKLRTRLTQDSLQNQLYIMNEGPTIKDYNPLPCIMHWFENTARTPHCSGHKLSDKTGERIEGLQLEASWKLVT